ncbi:unnamed protein product [Adineta steineri]|nr:unnamed protein product [Adineta steineri]
MTNLIDIKSHLSNDPIDHYIMEHTFRPTKEQNELLEYTRSLPEKFALMIGSTDAAQFFQILIRIGQYKRCIEVGTLSGYTAMTMAMALPDDGLMVTLDIDDKYVRPDIWKKAGVENKIDLRIKPAIDSLQDLLNEYGENSFDFIFIDGDKPNYVNYYDLCLRLVRSNGLIAIDNTLYTGFVADATKTDINTVTIRQLNDKIKLDQTVDVCQLRLGDGTTFVRKK